MRKILIPTDFSDCARRAEGVALGLAQGLGAEMILLHVSVEAPRPREDMRSLADAPREVYEAERTWADNALAARAAELRSAGVAARGIVRSGAAVDEILDAAGDERC